MKNTTTSKLKIATILLTTVALTCLLVWQNSQSKKATKLNYLSVETLKSTSLTTTKLVNHSQQAGIKIEEKTLLPVNSLQGSQPDGAVNLDDFGNVKADKDLHRLFDYFLSSLGEMEMPEIKKHLLTTASEFLSLDQLEQLRDYFDQYVQYLEQAENFAVSFNDDEPLDQRLSQIKDLRLSLLGKTMSEGFFAEEHAYADWTLSQKDIPTDQLTGQQLQWLMAENQATEYQDVMVQNHYFKEQQTSEAEIQAKRVETYGPEVAARLAALDQQHLLWQNKVDNYIAQRAQASSPIDLQNLHQQYSSIELKRLNAYWVQFITEG